MAAPETLTIEKEQGEASAVEERLPSRRKRNAAIFVPLAALWLVLDIATKAYFNGFSVGQVVAGPFLGLVQFRLVHNTGAAWGMFDESTFALGVMSVLVCVALTVYLFTAGKRAGVMETVGIALIVAGTILQFGNTYTYTVRDMDADSQLVSELFGQNNQIVLLFPTDTTDEGYQRQRDMLTEMQAIAFDSKPIVNSVQAMVTTGAQALEYYDVPKAAQLLGYSEQQVQMVFNQLGVTDNIRADALIERLISLAKRFSMLVPKAAMEQLNQAETLLNTANSTFNGAHYARALLSLNLAISSPYAHDAVQQIETILYKYYGEDGALSGMLVAMDDIATSFTGDMARVSLITIGLVFLIVMISFRSLIIPAMLVCLIQGAVYINMAFSGLVDGSVFFMCYLICVALQMGATIDYGILLTSHYRRCRSALPPREAVAQAMQMSLQTILTSGLALITAGFAVGKISTVFYISSIGTMLARGAVVSVLLILFLLPQLLIWLDRWMIKKNSKKAELSSEPSVQ